MKRFSIILILFSTLHLQCFSQNINPTARYTDTNGQQQESTDIDESAPLTVNFYANPSNLNGYSAHYEWHFYTDGKRDSPYLVRYETDTQVTFTNAGSHYAELWAIFTNGTDTVAYTNAYWTQEGQPIHIIISDSKLEFPNAFSPNGDGINDIYKAKEGYRSIISFHADIYSRWGTRIYSWDNLSDGWDGKVNGKDAPQGVYFVRVKAKGADGKIYDIKRDVNLLRGFTPTTGTE